MPCQWCLPTGNLTGPRCRECERVYSLHVRAESDSDAERQATRWIWEHAEGLRSPVRDELYRREGVERLDGVPVVFLDAMFGGRRRVGEYE